LCVKERHTVASDTTVTVGEGHFQNLKKSPHRSYAIRESMCMWVYTGQWSFFYRKQKIATVDSKTTHARIWLISNELEVGRITP
jgi:hypothetical protein